MIGNIIVGHFNFENNNTIVPKDVDNAIVQPTVTSIRSATFSNCTLMRSIQVPNSVRDIGSHAFDNCTSLTSIDIPNSMTCIGSHASKNCTSLTSINIPNSVTYIGGHAFKNCTSLTSINISNSVTEIETWAFSECTSLTSIIIPDSVTEIRNFAFYGCISLRAINIPDSVTEIGQSAFCSCTSVLSISIPKSVTKIGDEAFCSCTSLVTISIPISVTEIGFDPFGGCTSLTLITIPQDANADRFYMFFEYCDSLQQRQVNGYNHHQYTLTWLQKRFDNLPLHQAIYNSTNSMTTTLLTSIIEQHTSSMLISIDAMLMTPLHVLCCSPTVTPEMIRMLKAACPDAASMRNVLGETPLMMYLKCKKKEYDSYHVNGQLLPLVELLELGIECEVLKVICIFYNEEMLASELAKRDDLSGILPFMYGVLLSDCGLDVVYELAMRRQDLLVDF